MNKKNYFYELRENGMTGTTNVYFGWSLKVKPVPTDKNDKWDGPFASLAAAKRIATSEVKKTKMTDENRAYLNREIKNCKVEEVDEIKEEERDEWFNYIGCAFSVNKAKELTKRLKEVNADIEGYKRLIFPTRTSQGTKTMPLIRFDEEHAKKVDTSTPIIIAVIEFDGEPSHIIIDGNHRVFKRLWIEKKTDIKAFILTPEETYQIMEGPLKENVRKELKKAGKL